jgi:hypothetical protein
MRKIVDKVTALAETEGMPLGLKIVSKTDTILYNLAWIAGVDAPDDDNNDNDDVPDDNNNNNDNNNADKIQDDEMHPDNIAGLAPTRQQDNTHDQINNEIEIVDGQQEQTDDNEEIKIVFELDEEETDDKEDPEDNDEPDHPEFDRLIQTRSGQVSRL